MSIEVTKDEWKILKDASKGSSAGSFVNRLIDEMIEKIEKRNINNLKGE